jgi:hypothetical protein
VEHGMPASHMDLAQELAYTCYLNFARWVYWYCHLHMDE